MSRWIYLSHFLDTSTPAYGGGETFQTVFLKSMERNDSCNTARWTLPNHIGTHIDCPRHFSRNGKTLSDYPAEFWLFKSVSFVDISPVTPAQQIDMTVLQFGKILPETDLLLIKTGFGEKRSDQVYWEENPSFSSDLAEYLRKQCTKLRVMGFDTISLSSWKDRELGRKAHRAFLDTQQPIMLLEDMDFSQFESGTPIIQVIISPLPVRNADASPCTVLAEVEV